MAAATSGLAGAQNVPGGTHLVERRADFDEPAFAAAVGRAAEIRQVWESVAFRPAMWNNVRNSMNGLQFGFGYAPGTFVLASAGHGPSAVYSYGEYVWQKYRLGEFFDLRDAAGTRVSSNLYVTRHSPVDENADPDDENGLYQDASIEALQRRGLLVLTCHTAVEEQARGIVKNGFAPPGMSADAVAADILTHLIPGAIVVPSMVATLAVLQAKYQYAYITLAM
jgi:hypothetical protein